MHHLMQMVGNKFFMGHGLVNILIMNIIIMTHRLTLVSQSIQLLVKNLIKELLNDAAKCTFILAAIHCMLFTG